jgi:hypothetical protein
LRKDVKAMKTVLAEVDASIKEFAEAKAESKPEEWTVMENAVLTLLRCFKFVFEHTCEA